MEIKEALEKYYRGESSTAEERILKEAYRTGSLSQDPVLSYRGHDIQQMPDFSNGIDLYIRRRRRTQRRKLWLYTSSLAACLLLFLYIREVGPHTESVQLTDNVKRERLEYALKTLGSVLEDRHGQQQILYEDHNLIIAVE